MTPPPLTSENQKPELHPEEREKVAVIIAISEALSDAFLSYSLTNLQ